MERLGHRVLPVTLISNIRLASLDENVKAILEAIEAEIAAGHKVCVVGHSISGVSVVLALSQFLNTATAEQKSRIVQVLFIACFFDAPRSTAKLDWSEVNFDTGSAGLGEAKITRPAEKVFYNDMPAVEAARFVAGLEMHTVEMAPEDLAERVRLVKAGFERTCYLVCLKDNAIPVEFQRMEAEEAGFPAVEIEVDHCPMVSQPQTLANEIHKILSVE